MIKIDNDQLVASRDALATLSQIKLPVKTSFKLAKTIRLVDAAYQDFVTTLRKLQDEHAQRDENDERVVENNIVQMKDLDEFNKAFNELKELELDLELEQLSLDDLGDVSIEPSVLFSVEWLFKD